MKWRDRWFLRTITAAFFFFSVSMIWVINDVAPPTWDDGLYLNNLLSHYQAFRIGSLQQILETILTVDTGRVPLGPMLPLPLALIFGPTELVALLVVNAMWFVMGIAFYGIGRLVTKPEVGFLAFCMTGLISITSYITRGFFLDMFLAAWVVGTIFLILFCIKKNNRFWWALGLTAGTGTLIKVTYPVFVFIPLCVYGCWSILEWRKKNPLPLYYAAAAGIMAASISLPYFFINWEPLRAQSTVLNSPELAALYTIENPFTLTAISSYIYTQFKPWNTLLIFVGSIAATVYLVVKRRTLLRKHRWTVFVIAGWFILPFFVFGFGYIKDSRYIMPALPALATITAAGIIALPLSVRWLRTSLYGGLAVIAVFFALSSGVVPRAILPDPIYTFITGPLYYPFPDSRDFQSKETVSRILATLDKQKKPASVFFLGGSEQYHLALFSYEARLQGKTIMFHVLPYYADPDMTNQEAIQYILQKQPTAILYKTGENFPEFSSKNDAAIISYLDDNPELYERTDLGIRLPDGNRYFLYTSHDCTPVPDTTILEYEELSQPVLFGETFRLTDYAFSKQNSVYSLELLVDPQTPVLAKDQTPYTMYIHYVDKNDIIIGQQDVLLDYSCTTTEEQLKKHVFIPNDVVDSIRFIKMGVYIAPDTATMLPISGTDQTDWNGNRYSIPFDTIQ